VPDVPWQRLEVRNAGSGRGGIVINDNREPMGYETHIRPVFRDRDRQSMRAHFDPWSHGDVSQNADAILARLRSGTMPCDGAWPQAQVDLFERWIESGKPR
jgi:hypothetical protein